MKNQNHCEYPKIPKDIEITHLIEMDGDWTGDTLGYFAEGHWEARSFAIAANQYQADYWGQIDKPVHVSEVRHGYYVKSFVDEEGEPLPDGRWMVDRASSSAEGAFAVTFADVGT